MPELRFDDTQTTSTGQASSVDFFFSWSEESLGDVAISIVMYTEKGFQWLMVSILLRITEFYINVG